jgi:hemoglobin
MSDETLYQRLGGYDAVAAATDDVLRRLLEEPLLKAYFNRLSQDSFRKLRQHFVDFLVSAAGGPAYYTGRDMQTTHAGLGINESEWQAFIKHVRGTLEDPRVPERESTEFVAFLETTKRDIVENPPTYSS